MEVVIQRFYQKIIKKNSYQQKRIKVFIDLYREKIIYKDKRLVNWDPKLLTAISDLEVDQREQEGYLWYTLSTVFFTRFKNYSHSMYQIVLQPDRRFYIKFPFLFLVKIS